MDVLSALTEIIRDLLIFVVAMTALLILLIVVVSRLPKDNPLKRVLTALCYRVGATLAAGAVAIPVEPIPGLDVLYDVAVPLALIWYWFTFFRDARRTMRDVTPRATERPPQITQRGR
jgi:predicted permease